MKAIIANPRVLVLWAVLPIGYAMAFAGWICWRACRWLLRHTGTHIRPIYSDNDDAWTVRLALWVDAGEPTDTGRDQ